MCKVFSILLLGCLMMVPVSANYTFLGNVLDYKFEDSTLLLSCEKDFRLEVQFLLPHMFRVILHRSDYAEPLLDYPLVKTTWASVPLQLTENDKTLLIRSSALDLKITKTPCRLTVFDKEGNILQQDDPGMGIGWDGKEVKTWKVITPEEKFFGLGEKTGGINKRGKEWVLWNRDDPGHGNRSDPIYQSIPFFIGMRGHKAYGVYFNNSYRSKFNLGAGNLRYYSFSAAAGTLDYFFIYGPAVRQVVESYTELTGRTPMPPLWSLGYQQCRWSYFPEAKVLRIAETFRERKIPADVIYLDIHYMDGYRVFTWDKDRFPDPVGLMEKLQKLGFQVVVIIDPGVKVDPKYKVYEEGVENNYFVRYPDNELFVGQVWPGACHFPDFSNSAARKWWGNLFAGLLDTGVKGFWNDMNEPAVWGEAFPEEALFHDEGRISSQKKMHNLYGFLMAKACYEGVKKLRPELRPFVITRAGFAGEQRFTSVWTGDNQATEEHLAMGIRMLQGMGISGIPFVGTDIGGFGGNATQELFTRWMAASVYVPFFRTHSQYGHNEKEPWTFGEVVEGYCKNFIEERYRMLPYLYSLFWESHKTGAPILRPLFWHNQEDPEVYDYTYDEQFYVGSHVLVAPVVKMGQDVKKVYLPQGRWLEKNTEKIYEGGKAILVEAPISDLPVFWKEGAILPSGPVMQYVGAKKAKELYLDIFPAGDSQFSLYEDDGLSFQYESGLYSLTEFTCMKKEKEILFTQKRLVDRYNTGERLLTLRFHATSQAPQEIVLEVKGERRLLSEISETSHASGWRYDSAKNILFVQFPDDEQEKKLTIR